MKLKDIDSYLQELLHIQEFTSSDSSLNGIQVGDKEADIQCCAFAVDACHETINRAAAAGAQMLFVHHGLFWGRPLAITGSHYKRVKALLDNNIALYATHLPLDAHNELGNNIKLAQRLKLKSITPFGNYKGKMIGFEGKLEKPMDLSDVIQMLGIKESQCLKVLPFGAKAIESVAIVSGGAPHEVEEAIQKELDLYITGDASHEVYHLCSESQINMVSCGHYFTETTGVQAVSEKMQQDLKLRTIFIDLPTGL